MLEDVAEAVIAQLRLADAASELELRASGIDYTRPDHIYRTKSYCDVLKVTAPMEDGALVVRVRYLDNHDKVHADGDPRMPIMHRNGWQTLAFGKADCEGAATFIAGFLYSGDRSNYLALYKQGTRQELASWPLVRDVVARIAA